MGKPKFDSAEIKALNTTTKIGTIDNTGDLKNAQTSIAISGIRAPPRIQEI
jgi:hypothetical protein